jgi:hypothetical protein
MADKLKNFAKLLTPSLSESEAYQEAPQILFYNKDAGVSLKCFVKCRDEDCRLKSMIDSIDQIYPVVVIPKRRETFWSSMSREKEEEEEEKGLILDGKKYSFKQFSWYCSNCYNKNTESFTIPDNKEYFADLYDDSQSNENSQSHENTQPQEDTTYQRQCRMVIKKIVRCKSFKKKSTHPYKSICERLHGIERSLDAGLDLAFQ